MTTIIYELTSWLVEREYEDHLGSAEIFFVCAIFGTRTFVHFKGFEAWEQDAAERLLARVKAADPGAEHVLNSEHWGPHPYCDGSLQQRLSIEAEVEEHERFAATHGGHCDSEKIRQRAAEEIVG